ncbi:MAG: hypothetical protein E6I65_02345 [Chloroflexi bacterium]|nr:MAG: hypothetical protein E6I65_02345 [Chloroflexota bacterium]
MFILYAIPIGLALGFALGGRPAGLARLEFRWPWLVLAGLFIQVILFTDFVAARIGGAGALIYVGSTAAVFGGVLRNVRISGMPLVALGAASNLAAIVANGGYMPAGGAAMAALGKTDPTLYSNSAVVAHPALEPLTDIFALPAWIPFANIFSVGDMLIGLGVVVIIVASMRGARASGGPHPNYDEATRPV